MITIYSKKGCPFCENAIKISEIRGVEHQVKKLDVDYTVEEMLALTGGNHRTFPLIIDEGTIVGGFDEYKQHLVGSK